jgi:hypothetical protein
MGTMLSDLRSLCNGVCGAIKFEIYGELQLNGPFSTSSVWMAQPLLNSNGNRAAVAKENSNVCAYPLI